MYILACCGELRSLKHSCLFYLLDVEKDQIHNGGSKRERKEKRRKERVGERKEGKRRMMTEELHAHVDCFGDRESMMEEGKKKERQRDTGHSSCSCLLLFRHRRLELLLSLKKALLSFSPFSLYLSVFICVSIIPRVFIYVSVSRSWISGEFLDNHFLDVGSSRVLGSPALAVERQTKKKKEKTPRHSGTRG